MWRNGSGVDNGEPGKSDGPDSLLSQHPGSGAPLGETWEEASSCVPGGQSRQQRCVEGSEPGPAGRAKMPPDWSAVGAMLRPPVRGSREPPNPTQEPALSPLLYGQPGPGTDTDVDAAAAVGAPKSAPSSVANLGRAWARRLRGSPRRLTASLGPSVPPTSLTPAPVLYLSFPGST